MKKIFSTLFVFCALTTAVFCATWKIEDGMAYIQNGQYEKAVKFFEGYVSNNPNDAEGHYYLGLSYKHTNQMKKSAQHLQKSYELSKNLPEISVAPITGTHLDYINDYIDMANLYIDSKDYKKALQYAELIEKASPENVQANLIKTQIYLYQNDKQRAKVFFQKALMVDNTLLNSNFAKTLNVRAIPKYDFDYYNTKGLEYFYGTNIDSAIEYFEKAIALEPANKQIVQVYNNIAIACMLNNNLPKARMMLSKALSADKNYSGTYLNFAKLEGLAGTNEKRTLQRQMKYYEKAIKANPNNKFAYIELANYYLGIKDYDSAIKNFQNAAAIDTGYYEAYMGLAVSYMEIGRYSDAIKALRKAGSLNTQYGENADMLYYMAKICLLDNKYDEAKDYLLKAIKKNENANYYMELGKIYYIKDDYPSALTSFNKALELDTDFENEGDIFNYLGLCHYKNFDTDKAIYAFKKAVELQPNRAMYVYNLAQAYKSSEEKELYEKTINSISRIRPRAPEDVIDLATIYFDRKNPSMALKILDDGINKYPKERALYEAKLKYFTATKDTRGVSEVQSRMKQLFN